MNIFSFNGRLNRIGYIKGNIIIFIFLLAIFIIKELAFALIDNVNVELLGYLLIFPVFVYGISIAVKRLHDLNLSGWWVLVSMIFFGSLFLTFQSQEAKDTVINISSVVQIIVFWFIKGTNGPNKYGEGPISNKSQGDMNDSNNPKIR